MTKRQKEERLDNDQQDKLRLFIVIVKGNNYSRSGEAPDTGSRSHRTRN
jgi:hypothetical protein